MRCDASGSDRLTYLRAGGGQFAAVGVHDGNLEKTASEKNKKIKINKNQKTDKRDRIRL